MIQITINHDKFWNVVAFGYIICYVVLQVYLLQFMKDAMLTLMIEVVINLTCCQFIPLGMSLNRLNNEYEIRSKIFPFYFKFNDHTSIERRKLTEVAD